MLAGERPWPPRTTARQRERARAALHTLLYLRQVRHHVALGTDNARLAAHAALRAGLLAGDAPSIAKLRVQALQGSQQGGRTSAGTRQQQAEALLSAFDSLKGKGRSYWATARTFLQQQEPTWQAGTDRERDVKIEKSLASGEMCRYSADKKTPGQQKSRTGSHFRVRRCMSVWAYACERDLADHITNEILSPRRTQTVCGGLSLTTICALAAAAYFLNGAPHTGPCRLSAATLNVVA